MTALNNLSGIVANVFIHPAAEDKKKNYEYNYQATKLADDRAVKGCQLPKRLKKGRKPFIPSHSVKYFIVFAHFLTWRLRLLN